jgi:hypothetical protein
LVFSNTYRNGGGADFACNKISLYGGGNNPTTTSINNEAFGFGVAVDGMLEYFTWQSHVFYTGTTGGTNYGTERMRIASNGNIGIGTTAAPSNSLTGTPQLAIGSIGYGISGENNDNTAGIYIGDVTVYARWRIGHGNAQLNLYQNNGSGTYNYRGAFANNTGTYSSVSDKRLKKNIEPIQYGLKDVLKFKPVSYFMENQNEDIDKKNLGFLAQDLEDIVPEIVNVQSSNDSNYIYSLQYSSIIPILIKAIQELNEIVLHNNTSNLVNV